jgi:hypothetical protein
MKTPNPASLIQIIRLLIVTSGVSVLALAATSNIRAQTLNPGVLDPTNTYEGKTYAYWSAAHWQWVYSLPTDEHPLFDTGDVSVGQTGDVWFLGGTYTTTTDTNGVIYGTAVRDCTIPQGKALFFALIDAESSTAEGNGTNYAELLANSQALIDGVDTLSCTIDGQTVSNLTAYRAASDLFTWGPLPTNNVFGDPVNFPAGTTSQAVADGYYMLVLPMAPGDHTIHFMGGVPGFELNITYNIIVTPTNGDFPNNGVVYGKSYRDWAAGFGKWWFGLYFTNNPTQYVPPYAPAPLGTGQGGPVWYIAPLFDSGVFNRTSTIPAGTAVFALVGVYETDNAACPHNTSYTTNQLLAQLASYMNTTTNLLCLVDGVAVPGLTNAAASPYRVQSVFTYTEPAVHNASHDDAGLACYQNTAGIPYTVTNAVNDVVGVMIPPLSVGVHTIRMSAQNPGLGRSETTTWTLTVAPSAPALAVSQQGGMLNLTWPQSATDYEVQTTSSLNPPDWEPANLPVTTAEGIFQVSTPSIGSPRFFRLYLH